MKRNLLKKEEDETDPISAVSNLLMWRWCLPWP